VGSILEVDFVTHIGAQSDRSEEAFHTHPGINCRRRIASGDVAQGALKSADSVQVRNAEIDQSSLEVPNRRTGPPLVANFGPNSACKVRSRMDTSSDVTPLENVVVKFRLKS
jgi:hypothetical protein